MCNNLKYVIAYSAITYSSQENIDPILQGSRSTSLCVISGIHHCVKENCSFGILCSVEWYFVTNCYYMMHEIPEEHRAHVQVYLHKIPATAFLQLKNLPPTMEVDEVNTVYNCLPLKFSF